MPDGTSPTSAVRQQAAGPASKGLRIGGIVIPWWALGVGAVGVGLVGFLIYRNMRAGSASASSSGVAQSPMSPGVSNQGTPTAATLVPLPYPTAGTTSGSTATQASGLGLVATMDPNSTTGQVPVFSENKAHQGIIGYLPVGSELQNPTPFIGYAGDQGYSIPYGGQQGFVQAIYTGANPSSQSLGNTQLAGSTAG